ncbi:MAG TPA: hypothetical protein VGB45_02490 [Abditibacterium sp.]
MNPFMTRQLWTRCFGILVGAVILGLYRPLVSGDARGLWEFMAAIFAFYILVPCGMFLLLHSLWLLSSQKSILPLKPWFFLWAFCIFLVCLFTLSNGFARDWQIRRARQFVEGISPTLDKIKVKTGRYPDPLPKDLQKSMPRILRYSADERYYFFDYSDGLMQGYGYNSQIRGWNRWD